MAKKQVGNTASGAAACRLIEQYQPENIRLFNDPLVKDLLPALARMLMKSASLRTFMIKAFLPGIYGAQICRTRYIDEAVQTAIAQGIEQVVILGAGLDTRAYRLPGMNHVQVYEVDLPAVQEAKKQRLQRHFGSLPRHVTFVPIDFDTESLEAALARTAFAHSSPAVFVWEGVTQYLTEDTVRKTLAYVGASAAGSVLVFTYVLRSVVERRSDLPGAAKIMDTMAKRGSPWLFGLEPADVADFLQPFHLRLIEDVGNADYQARYLKPLGRSLEVSEMERVAQATMLRS